MEMKSGLLNMMVQVTLIGLILMIMPQQLEADQVRLGDV